MTFGIVVNIARDKALELGRKLASWLDERNIGYLFETKSAEKLQIDKSAPIERLSLYCDAFISLGGDGTLLFTSHYAMTKPVIGVNVGYLGFLTEFRQDEMLPAIEKLIEGNYLIHNRTQLEASVTGKSGPRHFRALNDVVIEKGTYPRIPTFVISLDGQLLSAYRADGIIIATSTGSTAYSMSAGGPIIAPKSNVFVITPICPHMLAVRPVVVSDDKLIEVSVDAPDGNFPLNCDGHLKKLLSPQEVVTVRKSSESINLVANEKRNYFEILRNKLLWGREHNFGQ
ncbi:MAG: NAD(+)/NADH kinase [Chlorobiaceae bacterium]|nr:NAD(+)/NADH kinase [Chlorobiaceae bacterium]NTW10455.1 NAD(+)/NADH kinase [Chlorobiaceae bacterium]